MCSTYIATKTGDVNPKGLVSNVLLIIGAILCICAEGVVEHWKFLEMRSLTTLISLFVFVYSFINIWNLLSGDSPMCRPHYEETSLTRDTVAALLKSFIEEKDIKLLHNLHAKLAELLGNPKTAKEKMLAVAENAIAREFVEQII